MYFETGAAAWAMEGHGAYVWWAYLVTMLALVAMVLAPLRRLRRHVQWISGDIKRRGATEPVRADGAAAGENA